MLLRGQAQILLRWCFLWSPGLVWPENGVKLLGIISWAYILLSGPVESGMDGCQRVARMHARLSQEEGETNSTQLKGEPRARFISRKISEIELAFCKFTKFLTCLMNRWKKLQLNLNFDFNPHFTVYQNAQKVQLKYLVALFVHFKFKCKCKFKCKFNFRNLTTNEPGPSHQ